MLRMMAILVIDISWGCLQTLLCRDETCQHPKMGREQDSKGENKECIVPSMSHAYFFESWLCLSVQKCGVSHPDWPSKGISAKYMLIERETVTSK